MEDKTTFYGIADCFAMLQSANTFLEENYRFEAYIQIDGVEFPEGRFLNLAQFKRYLQSEWTNEVWTEILCGQYSLIAPRHLRMESEKVSCELLAVK